MKRIDLILILQHLMKDIINNIPLHICYTCISYNIAGIYSLIVGLLIFLTNSGEINPIY
jgi:ABC-type methionine transport system permease subunit